MRKHTTAIITVEDCTKFDGTYHLTTKSKDVAKVFSREDAILFSLASESYKEREDLKQINAQLLRVLKDEHESEFMGSSGCVMGKNCATCKLIAKTEGK